VARQWARTRRCTPPLDIPLSAYARDTEAWLPFVGTYSNVDVFFKIAQVLSK
jgi:hypothetical protein